MNGISQATTVNEKNITIKKAAELMGKSEQFVRIGLRNNRLPFRYRRKIKYTMDLLYFTTTLLFIYRFAKYK